MADVQVNLEKRQFIIRARNPDEGSAIMKLPSRRWMQTRGVFVVPMNRLNMKALLEAHGKGRIALSPESLKEARDTAESKIGNREFPSWFSFKLPPRKVQREALLKIYKNDVGALLMKMGRGKSKTAIDINTAHFYERRIELVVAVMPLAVTPVWGGDQGELAKHSPSPFTYIFADDKFNASKIRLKQDSLLWILVGIESLSQGKMFDRLLPVFQNYKVALLVDEASRIKNHKAVRTEKIKELGKLAVIKLIATGTPNPKSLIDLFSLYEFLDPNIIGAGDFWSFRNRYAIMGGYKNKDIVAYDNTDELFRLIEPYTYTCGKDPSLPKQLWLPPRYTKLTDEQREIYRKVKKSELEGVTVANVLSRILRLQQVVGGFYSLDPTKKVNPITGKIRTIKGDEVKFLPGAKNPKIIELHHWLEEHDGSPVIIWAKFLSEIDDLQLAMADHGRVVRLTGGLTMDERITIRDDFQDGKYEFLVGNAQSGGLGLTLTRSHTMVFYSNTHNGEDRMQSEDRIHRDGQDESCMYMDLIAKGTVDEPVFASNIEKKDLDTWVREKLIATGRDPRDPAEIFKALAGEIE